MGYKRNRKVYNLKFGDDTDYPGLEVQIRTLTIGQLVKVWSGEGGAVATFDMFAERIVGWNLEDEDGRPVPVTREGLEDQDDDLITAIIGRWNKEVMGVPAPLESDSDSGETSEAELMLAEIPSQSLAS